MGYINQQYALQKLMGYFKDSAYWLQLVKGNPSKLIDIVWLWGLLYILENQE